LLTNDGLKFFFLLIGSLFLSVWIQADELFFPSSQGDYSGVKTVFEHDRQWGQDVGLDELFQLEQIIGFVLIEAQYDWYVGSYYFHLVISGLGVDIPTGKHDISFICDSISRQFYRFFHQISVKFLIQSILENHVVFEVVRQIEANLLLYFMNQVLQAWLMSIWTRMVFGGRSTCCTTRAQ
jgi:hypothetical protein